MIIYAEYEQTCVNGSVKEAGVVLMHLAIQLHILHHLLDLSVRVASCF